MTETPLLKPLLAYFAEKHHLDGASLEKQYKTHLPKNPLETACCKHFLPLATAEAEKLGLKTPGVVFSLVGGRAVWIVYIETFRQNGASKQVLRMTSAAMETHPAWRDGGTNPFAFLGERSGPVDPRDR